MTPSPKVSIDDLVAAALEAASLAYAPYSGLRVGAALVTDDDQLVIGCNVENSSYGLTLCAERNAIFSAVAQFGPTLRIRALAVVLSDGRPISPCGACRQVISEFSPDATVVFRSPERLEQVLARDLLPYGFRLEALGDD